MKVWMRREDGKTLKREMNEANFALKIARAHIAHPDYDDHKFVAMLLELKPEEEMSGCLFTKPCHISAFSQERIISVKFEVDGREAMCFVRRDDADNLVYVPPAKNCSFYKNRVSVYLGGVFYDLDSSSPLYPWIGLYPGKFQRLVRFQKLLTPSDTNPLTGILQASRRETRNLAKQVVKELENLFGSWVADIVSDL